MAEHPAVLNLVASLMQQQQPQVPAVSEDLEMASEDDVSTFLDEVRVGSRDEEEIAFRTAAVQRRLGELLTLI